MQAIRTVTTHRFVLTRHNGIAQVQHALALERDSAEQQGDVCGGI
jgi:hypothetical protein